MFQIHHASLHEMPLVKALFSEYADSLSFDLGFQNFGEELAGLPGDYREPEGVILIARETNDLDNQMAGVIALRPFEPGIGEIKRLYVRPAFRGQGVGRQLAEAIIEEAKYRGYLKLRLDTVSEMKAATALYRSLGFKPIPAYRDNPIPGALFFQRELR